VAISRNQSTVLDALAASGGELSGLELADLIGTLARSSVYAALSALQRDGLVDARWDLTESHPRRMVRINKSGLAAINAAANDSANLRARAKRSKQSSRLSGETA
jgi:DNA-binding PadR family transcriptional regulator